MHGLNRLNSTWVLPCLRLCASVLLLLMANQSARACKYSVRDVGFVDLKAEPYLLYCLVDGKQHAEFSERFKKIAKKILPGGNVRAELVDVSIQPEHAVLQRHQVAELPQVILVEPTGAIPDLVFDSQSFGEDSELTTLLERIVASPVRDEILESIIPAYAVVVLVEGPSSSENKRVSAAVQFAVEQLNGIMAELDKPVEVGPKLVMLPLQRAKSERVLLWSWGIEADKISEPSVVLLFGRGRRLGPVKTGSEISGTELFETLSLVGKSCECELDRSWMQGPMFPQHWDAARQSQVAERLGFDAENPLVKVEISRIIARGPSNRRPADATDVISADPLLGYGESDIDDEEALEEEAVSPAQLAQEAESPQEDAIASQSSPAPISAATQQEKSSEVGLSAMNTGLLTVAALGIIGLGGGLFLVMRGRA